MSDLHILEALREADRDACYAIRIEVFCGEQKVSQDIEFDGMDDICRHYLARDGDLAVGTARTRPLGDGTVKFERIAVLRPYRGRDIGRALMDRALADARRDGHRTAVLHAQSQAGTFYAKFGFAQEGGGFMEAGIPHIRMALTLD